MKDIGGDFNVSFSVDKSFGDDYESLFEIGDVDREPQPLIRLKPIYPTFARIRGIEGSVQVEFTINADGRTEDIIVISSAPATIFNRAARRAVKRWHFSPAMLNGRPVAVKSRQSIKFEIE